MRYAVYPLKVGEWTDPEPRIFYLGDCSKTVKIFNYFWLVRSDKYNILVDSGVTRKDGIKINPGFKQSDNEHPLRQLKKYGLIPENITHVILTHGHWDHLSPVIMRYKNAEIYLQEREWNAIFHPQHPWFAKFVFIKTLKDIPEQFGGKFHIIKKNKKILPGISVFLTGGHTPGSQAVSVQTEKGKAIITGDAVFTYRNLNEDIPCGFNSDLTECFLSMEKIRKTADIILPSHDPLVLEGVRGITKGLTNGR